MTVADSVCESVLLDACPVERGKVCSLVNQGNMWERRDGSARSFRLFPVVVVDMCRLECKCDLGGEENGRFAMRIDHVGEDEKVHPQLRESPAAENGEVFRANRTVSESFELLRHRIMIEHVSLPALPRRDDGVIRVAFRDPQDCALFQKASKGCDSKEESGDACEKAPFIFGGDLNGAESTVGEDVEMGFTSDHISVGGEVHSRADRRSSVEHKVEKAQAIWGLGMV